MLFVLVLVLVSLQLLDAAEVTTLDVVFTQNYNETIRGFTERQLRVFVLQQRQIAGPNYPIAIPFTEELYEYLKAIEFNILGEFLRVLEAVPAQTFYDDLNEHCSEYQKMPIEDLAEKPRNTSCVQFRFGEILKSNFEMAVEVGLRQVSLQCIQKKPSFCSVANLNCTLAHEERMRGILIGDVEDWNKVPVVDPERHVDIIMNLMDRDLLTLFAIYSEVGAVYKQVIFAKVSSLTVKPFVIENLQNTIANNAITETSVKKENNTVSEDDLTWGIVKSNTGKFDRPCSHYKKIYPPNSEEFINFLSKCLYLDLFQSTVLLMRCAYSDPKSQPVAWSRIPPLYFHSQCLCVAYEGKKCRVKAPQGVDPSFYCLSVLFRDFQRKVSYRPAVTYLDYASQTRVPVCKFSELIQVAFRTACYATPANGYVSVIKSAQCYFRDLVNKQLNCSETIPVDTFNHTVLCNLKRFTQLILCDEDTDGDVRVPYYGAGDSTMVLVLTYVDVAVRVLTLVTYLACPQLRNLPGKLLIAYQVTAVVRPLAVRTTLEDMPLAVRLDVAMDLASTLWLTAYLHFLTVSIETLRLPDSLTPDEVRVVLLRYTLFGWALPTVLAATFFWMDEAVDSRVQFGQLLFVVCNYAALFANLYMSFKNFNFYYDVKTSARLIQVGATARSVFTDLFNFAVKTSVLSGAGITFRLIFTQIQGLAHLLGYYHVLGTIQGLLLFILYGCNRESRVFWIGVFRSTIQRWSCRQNTSDS